MTGDEFCRSYEEDGSGGEGYLPAWKAQALDYGRTVIPVFAGVLLLYQVAAQLGYS